MSYGTQARFINVFLITDTSHEKKRVIKTKCWKEMTKNTLNNNTSTMFKEYTSTTITGNSLQGYFERKHFLRIQKLSKETF